jgi:hypothetical protein
VAQSQLNIPSFVRSALSGSRPIQLTFADVADTNIQSTSSFMYDVTSAPLKSTQQLKVDWSKFENHTFFSSAESKINFTFDQLINGYPFDGTRQEVEAFVERLTGFENWVLTKRFPTYKGQLLFSGTQVGEATGGTSIEVKDTAGGLYPEISKNRSGDHVLNPKGTSFSAEMQLFLPQIVNSTQFIFQKMSGSTDGMAFYLMSGSSTDTVEARFSVISRGFGDITVPFELKKGVFNHVCVQMNRETSMNFLEAFVNEQLVATSRTKTIINDLDNDTASFFIGVPVGSGTINLSTGIITQSQTLSGTLDEFRVFHSVRSIKQQANFAKKSIFSTPDLKLYYRFNEPPPPIMSTINDPVNGIVIDSSGNSLHALINNFTGSLRQNAALDTTSNLIYEKSETLPVLFPSYQPVIDLNVELLTSASLYDAQNPNLITKLIPQHYLLEGAQQDGFELTNEIQKSTGIGVPGDGQKSTVQIMLSLLYIWAKFFDEIKLYVDAFRNLRTVSYDDYDCVPNNFMLDLLQEHGIYLPPLFNDASIEQYVRAENIDLDAYSTFETSLRTVQHELLKRIVINLPDILKSKGTLNSVKTFLRAMGIDPDNSMRLREYGGPTNRTLEHSREDKRTVGTLVQFSTSSIVTSQFLMSPRVEPGIPLPAGMFITNSLGQNVSTTILSDNLLTSGSWTCETLVRFLPNTQYVSQSIARLCVTGSSIFNVDNIGTIVNVVATSGSSQNITLYARPCQKADTLMLTLPMLTQSIFDNDQWNVCFGVERGDLHNPTVILSSSYFLRIGKQNAGEIDYLASTSSMFYEYSSDELSVNAFTTLSQYNASGSYIVLGNKNILSGTMYLEDTQLSPVARTSKFSGLMSNLRFWSKAISLQEWNEHVRNVKSVGVKNPSINYNFNRTDSGSFEKLRIDTLSKQEVRNANTTGNIDFLDFSLNNMHMSGTLFPTSSVVIKGEMFNYSTLSPYFDEAVCNNKIRVRGYNDLELVNSVPWAGIAPVHEIAKNEQPTDDVRFSVEFSLVDALNRDITTIFSTLDTMGDAIGAPELMFSTDYPKLSAITNTYFNRLQSKLNFGAFFEYFRWFDTSISNVIEQLLPRKVKFNGTHFVVESHILERHKLQYQFTDQYLAEDTRARIAASILLQQVAGVVRKY